MSMKPGPKGWIISGIALAVLGGVIAATGFLPGLALVGLGLGMTGLGVAGHVINEQEKKGHSKNQNIKETSTESINDDSPSLLSRLFGKNDESKMSLEAEDLPPYQSKGSTFGMFAQQQSTANSVTTGLDFLSKLF